MERRKAGTVLVGMLALVLAGSAVVTGSPVLDPDLRANPEPVADYHQAVARVEAILTAEEEEALIEHGGSIAHLDQSGSATAVVLFHGYTNTPDEFRIIARAYRDLGYNVWVPRLPWHSPADKFSDGFSLLTSVGLRDFVDDVIDIASGLGERLVVVGLSGGGTLATWAAAHRPEIDQTILLTPLLLPAGVPLGARAPLVRLLRLSPVDWYQWWNPARKADNVDGMVYPRYSLKGIAALLGLAVEAGEVHTVTGQITLVRNEADTGVDADAAESQLRRLVGDSLDVRRIPAAEGLGHDFVAPDPEFGTDDQIRAGYRELSAILGIDLPDPILARAR